MFSNPYIFLYITLPQSNSPVAELKDPNIEHEFLFHFMLVGVTENQKSQTLHSQVLGKYFYGFLKRPRQLRN